MSFRLLQLGDTAFTIEFPELSGVEGARHIRQIKKAIEDHVAAGTIPASIDMISASRSLTICIDPETTDLNTYQTQISALLKSPTTQQSEAQATIWELPGCYEDDFAPDLPFLADQTGKDIQELIEIHSSQTYDVLLLGFLPGFPFMAELPEILRFPRRSSPRTKVPAGSIAVANNQTALYPWDSPGGWHLIGRCPVPLFNPNWDQPALLSPGDQVRFKVISKDEFAYLAEDLTTGKIHAHDFKQKGSHQ